jgi:hypothetical protein
MPIKLARRWSLGDAQTAGLGSVVPDKKGVIGKQRPHAPPRMRPLAKLEEIDTDPPGMLQFGGTIGTTKLVTNLVTKRTRYSKLQ